MGEYCTPFARANCTNVRLYSSMVFPSVYTGILLLLVHTLCLAQLYKMYNCTVKSVRQPDLSRF